VQVVAYFDSNGTQGLSEEQVLAASKRYGPNELAPDEPTSFWTLVIKQFDDMLVKILLAAAAVDFIITFSNGDSGFTAFVEPFVILLVLIANAAVGVTTESSAEAAILSLKALEAETANVIRGGQLTKLPTHEVVPGDILEVAAGQKVPADCYVISMVGDVLLIDQSILTGESGSVHKVAGRVEAPPGSVAQDKHNMLFSGSMVTSGRFANAHLSKKAPLRHTF
jgi:P-type Ca2+ transporter type 2A